MMHVRLPRTFSDTCSSNNAVQMNTGRGALRDSGPSGYEGGNGEKRVCAALERTISGIWDLQRRL